MKIGLIGLGKMGRNLAQNMLENGYEVIGLDKDSKIEVIHDNKKMLIYQDLDNFLKAFGDDRKILWMMLPAGEITENMVSELKKKLAVNDILVDGGNSNYKDSIRRASACEEAGIYYLDCGTSGGMSGARNGACYMVGGDLKAFQIIESVLKDTSVENGYLYTGKSGSGHFVKMIHNGIEYGMMQAIAEGFNIIDKSDFDVSLADVADVWCHGSVVRGWLMELASASFREDESLSAYQGIVGASGEGKWTVETAVDLDVPIPVISSSLMIRNMTQGNGDFASKVLSMLRNGFGGHVEPK